ncbi:MAG TPA: hypothetical protein VG797_10500, partial [Phycisphaerales bacterium]|nr:hypothetical protein [Phycisphaerales bacterium]
MPDPAMSARSGDTEGVGRRVLVLAPAEGDTGAIMHALHDGGFQSLPCADISDFGNKVGLDDFSGAGVFIVAQEALLPIGSEEAERLAMILTGQPAWSDLPVVLLASSLGGEDAAWEIARGLNPVGNITILERPLRRTTLINAVAVALRARDRQYELRATLGELAAHREGLQELVAKKSAELASSTASLAQAERLASLGTLAAGLGHDIANLALPIRTRLDALRECCPPGEAIEDVEAIQQALAHLSRLAAG